MRKLIFVCLFPLCLVFAQTNTSKTEEHQKTSYLVIYKPGPGWIAGKPIKEQPLKEHGQYMLKLYIEGAMKFAGPFLDDTGGAVVFEAENENAAKAVVAADPAVRSGVFTTELHPWQLVDWEQYVKKPGPSAK